MPDIPAWAEKCSLLIDEEIFVLDYDYKSVKCKGAGGLNSVMNDTEYVLEVSETPFRSESTFGLQFISYSTLLCNNNEASIAKLFLCSLFAFIKFSYQQPEWREMFQMDFFLYSWMYLDRKRSEARDVKKILFGKNRKFDGRKRCEWNSKNTINGLREKSEKPRGKICNF